MSRRRFLASLLALGAAAFAPAARGLATGRGLIRTQFVVRSVVLNEDWMVRAEEAAEEAAENEGYIAFIHPSMERDLRKFHGRWRWKDAWRAYRLARRAHQCDELIPTEVLARFADPPLPWPRLGSVEGINFITTGGLSVA